MKYSYFQNFLRKVLYWLFIFCNASFLNAQWLLGFKGGCTVNRLYTAHARGYFNDQRVQGYSLGLVLEYRTDSNLAFTLEPAWIEKNHKNISLSFIKSSRWVSTKHINNYLVLPVVAKFYIGQAKLKPFVDFGAYVSLWCSGTASTLGEGSVKIISSNDRSYLTPYEFDSRRDKRIENGLLGGLGLNYQTGPHNLFFESRYDMSLTDMHKYTEKHMEKKNNTLLVSIGYTYQF